MSQIFLLKYLGMCKNPLISTAGGPFHFITVQGRHLFKKTIFTVSTLPRAWLENPECVKDEGRLKPPSFRGRQAKYSLCGQRLQTSCRGRNVDIPLAGARRLISRPRKASVFHLR